MGRASINTCDQGKASILYQREQAHLLQVIAQIEADQTKLDALIVQREAEILEYENQLAEAVSKIDAQVSAFGTCLTTYGPEPSSEAKKAKPPPPPWPCAGMADVIKQNQQAVAGASAQLYEAKHSLAQIKAQKAGLDKLHIAYIAERDLPQLMDVWVADWTEDTENPPAASVTGTIEVWGMRYATDTCRMPRSNVILRPQYNPAERPYKPNRDFFIDGPMDSEAAMVFSHLATWCWIQEHRPRYITARITALSQITQLASVVRTTPVGLEAITGVTDWSAANVPFVYRDCGSRAFRVGDRVVVEFSGPNKADPRIIGFEDHPRSCEPQPPVLLWDATAAKYIKLELITDGTGAYWLRTDLGDQPLAGSFQWRNKATGRMVSCVSMDVGGVFGLRGTIFIDETNYSPPTSRLALGAALDSSDRIHAICKRDTGTGVSIWRRPRVGGAWEELGEWTDAISQASDRAGPVFFQSGLAAYMYVQPNSATAAGLYKIEIVYSGASVTLSLTAQSQATTKTADFYTRYGDGNPYDLAYDASTSNTMETVGTTSIPVYAIAYDKETCEPQAIAYEARTTSRFEVKTAGLTHTTSPEAFTAAWEGEYTTEFSLRRGDHRQTRSYASSDEFTEAYTFPSPVSDLGELAQTSIVYDNSSPWFDCLMEIGENVAIMNPQAAPSGLLFTSGSLVTAHISAPYPNPAADPDTAVPGQHDFANILSRADGSKLAHAITVDGGDLYGPMSNRSPPINFIVHEEFEDQGLSNTAVILQELFRYVLTLPNGMAVGFCNSAPKCAAIDGGDLAALVPEWAAGHTIYCIGYTKGWKGRGLAGPT